MSTTQGLFRVLIAEDDPLALNLMISTLTGAGYLVDYCENGRQALRMLRERAYALLVTDLRMPLLSGDDLIRRLRADGENLPALIITGSDLDQTRATVKDFEFVRVMGKPFNPSDLLHVVREMAGKVRG